MVYDSMSAWNRHAFEFNDNIQSRYVSLYKSNHRGDEILISPSGKMWSGVMTFASPQGRSISRDDYSPPPSPPGSSDDAPAFNEAKSRWSPPSSPRIRSRRYDSPSSRRSSPRASPVDSFGSPLTPKTSNEATTLASKLYAAACAGDTKHIRLLLSLGANVNMPTVVPDLYDAFKPAKPGNVSALAGAAGHGQMLAVKLLIASGAAINPTMRQSSSSPLHQACKADDAEMASFFLQMGADVNLLNCFNTTPLMYAGKYGSPALIRVILAYKPDLFRLSFINTAAIHWALWPGNEENMELLLQAGADPDQTVGNGNTPLHCAVLSGLPDIARVLIRYGADKQKRNDEWNTPVEVAKEIGAWDTLAVLEE